MEAQKVFTTESTESTESTEGRRVYVSGPMKGMPGLNYSAFFAAELKLEGAGYVVLSPTCLPEGFRRVDSAADYHRVSCERDVFAFVGMPYREPEER